MQIGTAESVTAAHREDARGVRPYAAVAKKWARTEHETVESLYVIVGEQIPLDPQTPAAAAYCIYTYYCLIIICSCVIIDDNNNYDWMYLGQMP